MLKMQNDNVLVMPLPKETKAGSIFIPENADVSHIKYRVIAVGPGKRNPNGTRTPMDVKPGDTVIAAKFNGTAITLDGVTLNVLSVSQLLVVLEEEPSLLGDLTKNLQEVNA